MSTEQNHLDSLLGAYALDAVDGDERRAVEQYLAVEPRAAAEVREHREVAALLSWTPVAAPDDLWSRISAAIDTAGAGAPDMAKVLPMVRPRRSLSTTLGWTLAAAAASVAVVTSVAALRNDRPAAPTLQTAFDAAAADRDSRQGTLVADGSDVQVASVIDEDGHGYIDAGDLPPLADDRTYQLWGVVGDQVISLGIFGPKPELESFSVDGEVSALVITIEVAGGVIANGNPEGAYVGELG